MLNIIIVDDEKHCIDRLSALLGKYGDSISILGSFTNVTDAIHGIMEGHPDIVFLDVVLPDGTGFDILDKIIDLDFDIVFTTAHNTYAVEAFEYSAIHYLLKPIAQGDLFEALDRYREKSKSGVRNSNIEALIYNLEVGSLSDKKLGLPTSDGVIFVKISTIIRLEASGNYVIIMVSGNKQYLITKSLKYYDNLLDKNLFFRTHQSHIVHLAFADKYNKGKHSHVLLSNGEKIPVSTRRKEAFLRQLVDNELM